MNITKKVEKIIDEWTENSQSYSIFAYDIDGYKGELDVEKADKMREEDYKQALKKYAKQIDLLYRKEMEKLLDLKQAKRLSKNMEIMFGKPECTICGCNPLKQRKMILDIFQSNKEEKK